MDKQMQDNRMSILWTPPRKSRVTENWHDPEWSLWSEPGIPLKTHKKMWPVWVVGVAFWLAVGVSVWWWRTW